MRELGADEHGRISYQEFLRRRLALRPEIEALRAGKRRSSPHTHTPEYLPTSSDNSLGKNFLQIPPISATNVSFPFRSETFFDPGENAGNLAKGDKCSFACRFYKRAAEKHLLIERHGDLAVDVVSSRLPLAHVACCEEIGRKLFARN